MKVNCGSVSVFVSVWTRDGVRTGLWPPQKKDWKQSVVFFFFFGESRTWFHLCSPTQIHITLFESFAVDSSTILYIHTVYSVSRVLTIWFETTCSTLLQMKRKYISPSYFPFPFVSMKFPHWQPEHCCVLLSNREKLFPNCFPKSSACLRIENYVYLLM